MKKIPTLTSIRLSRQVRHTMFIGTLLILTSICTMAQHKWSGALQVGANIPTQKLAGTKLDNGFGLEATLSYKVMPHVAAYAGWGWNRFSSNKVLGQRKADFEETGYVIGLRFIHPLPNTGLRYLIGAGAIYNHIEVENSKGDIVADTKHGWGWEANAGLQIPVTKRFSLSPNLRYRSLSRTLNLEGPSTVATLRYLSIGVGLNLAF